MPSSPTAPSELSSLQRIRLNILALFLRIWWRTLRFRWGSCVDEIIKAPPQSTVVILWHNRLFAAPEFFRRYFAGQQLATLISASADGAWLTALVRKLGMRPIRGSHHKRGAQAIREMLSAQKEGCHIAVTPDGSRGPMYDLKPGAVAVALKSGAPFVLLSLNFTRARRLESWDRFYLPWPFSCIDVAIEVIENPAAIGDNPKVVAAFLKKRMQGLTRD